ncbi:MAG: response regulator [Thermodesulfovibrionales bacterium]|nr:response regulator [Thermodesulfovibrionales bacterium]
MKTALIIEDNPDNMVLITRFLEKFGYHTLKAMTGLEGIEIALREKPDFILLDIQLPDIEGTEVLKRIRDSEIGRNIPIIAVTSYAMAGDRQRLLSAGCNGYIEKPIDPEQVISQIRELVGEAS